MALALEHIGWGTAEHWMRIQASYELAQARRERATGEQADATLASATQHLTGLGLGAHSDDNE